ncbi:hypothetical protein SSPO_048140 [Streptomyces antimycoticus]|uniref:Chaplin domain-containing protein n=1 Tax=Streptomyces antimycoticus TaxID=68175 RepID=A0A499V0X3_9ACTN|nr:hypothetical protein [Streptomyces antimycoticus]BBJ42096.1 hypothetical protein SSPO_048140 [Streptomyces antimycoticus]
MQISKKVALMAAAAAGTMVVGGAGSANASGLFPQHGGASQSNSCETNVGPEVNIVNLTSTGDINPNSDCVNVTNRVAVSQSNDCDSTTGITTTGSANLAPTGDVRLGSNCANIAIEDNPVVVVHKDPPKKHKAKDPHKAKKHHKAKADAHKAKKHHKAKVKAKKKDCKH